MATRSGRRKTGAPHRKKRAGASRSRESNVAPKEKASSHGTAPTHGMGRELTGTFLAIIAVFVAAALYSQFVAIGDLPPLGKWMESSESPPSRLMGPVGNSLGWFLVTLFGWCAWFLPLWIGWSSYRVWTGEGPLRDEEDDSLLSHAVVAVVWMLLTLIALSIMAAVLSSPNISGAVGYKISAQLGRLVGELGTLLLAAPLFLLGLGVSAGLGPLGVLSISGAFGRLVSVAVFDSTVATTRFLGPRFREAFTAEGAGTRFFARSVQSILVALLLPLKLGKKILLAPLQPLKELQGDSAEEDGTEEAEESSDEGEGETEERSARSSRRARRLARQKKREEGFFDENSDEESEEDQPAALEQKAAPKIHRPELKAQVEVARESEEDEEPSADDAGEESSAIQRLRKKSLRLRKKRAREKTEAADSEEIDEVVAGQKPLFELPSLELLVAGGANYRGPQDSELLRNSNLLEKTLSDFKIGGKIVEVQPGPVITLYEFAPAAGVKVQRIITLADDLALSLKVASVRVYAPVPGKGTVGIEVPNADREIVRLRDVLASDEFQSSDSGLTLALGKDTFGSPVAADLARMPHLLIAGATGTGKSVCINSMLLSLLYRNTPDQLRLIMIDPKMLELSLYEEIPHLLAPVVTNPKRARGVLWWAVEEMERRYRVMKEVGVRNLASYNRYASGDESESHFSRSAKNAAVIELKEEDVVATANAIPELNGGAVNNAADQVELPDEVPPGTYGATKLRPMPRIVIIVDEMADLMLTVGREVEELFTRLAQKARAAGIHLILATQRPSVNVITGLIKANFPARVSFQVASKIDARTVLDHSGAEKLLGQGDMLFLSAGTGRVRRLHSPFVSDKEVQTVVELLKRQAAPQYEREIEQMVKRLEDAEKGASTGLGGEDVQDEFDPLYDQAVNLVVEKGFASTSMVQRVFRIGYNRAARILETMEREGVVGPADGAKPRQVYVQSARE